MQPHEKIAFHYRLEKEFGRRIMNAEPGDRARVTLEAYDELFRRIPWHDGHMESAVARANHAAVYASFARMVGHGRDVLEVGCGNGEHLRDLAARNRSCVGVDISDVVLDPPPDLPPNVELMVADAVDLSPLPARRFDVVFSSQLIEHLHPEDLPRHLHEVARVLRPGGRYIFETPNRLGGPHDVSRHFDDVATGFHLREYTNGELLSLLRRSGFRTFRSPLFRNRAYRVSARLARLAEIPTAWKVVGETAIAPLPVRLRRRLAKALKLNILVEAFRS